MDEALSSLERIDINVMTISAYSMLVLAPLVSAFSSTQNTHQQLRPPTHVQSTISPTSQEDVVVNTKVPVTRVSVCAGELCQCQGEEFEFTGGASDAAISKLRGLNLDFPVDEVGCLGACGMGTMIAIDFENGDSILTDGLESTYTELGISIPKQTSSNESCEGNDIEALSDTVTAPNASMIKPSSKELVDVRDRMRQEAASVEAENPWLKMGSYLVQKAADKVFGSD